MVGLGCGATFYGESGVVMSPGYPDNYANNLNCTYDIIGNPQKNTIITFNPQRFHIEGLLNLVTVYIAYIHYTLFLCLQL